MTNPHIISSVVKFPVYYCDASNDNSVITGTEVLKQFTVTNERTYKQQFSRKRAVLSSPRQEQDTQLEYRPSCLWARKRAALYRSRQPDEMKVIFSIPQQFLAVFIVDCIDRRFPRTERLYWTKDWGIVETS